VSRILCEPREDRVRDSSRAILISISVCIIGLGACCNEVNPSQISGRYATRHQNGFETLDLHPDGTYMHEFTATNGTKSTSSVRWKWEPFEGEPKVALYDFTPRFPRSQSGGVVLLGVEKAWGRIRLYRSYDLDQYYAKE